MIRIRTANNEGFLKAKETVAGHACMTEARPGARRSTARSRGGRGLPRGRRRAIADRWKERERRDEGPLQHVLESKTDQAREGVGGGLIFRLTGVVISFCRHCTMRCLKMTHFLCIECLPFLFR